MTGFKARRISAQDGLSLYVRDYGDPLAARVPLLCLCGITRNSKDYHDLARREAARRRVIVPDYRGRGQSAWDPDWRNYQYGVYLSDIGHILATLGIDRVVLVGTSMGGLLGMALNAVKPTLLAGLVLNDIGPELVTSGGARIMERIGRDLSHPDLVSAGRYLATVMPNLSCETEDDWTALAERTYRLDPADGRWHVDWDINLVKPIVRNTVPVPDLWPLYRALAHLPVLAVRGGASDLLSAEAFARMSEAKPDLIAVTVPGVGHAPFLTEPAVDPIFRAFLDRF